MKGAVIVWVVLVITVGAGRKEMEEVLEGCQEEVREWVVVDGVSEVLEVCVTEQGRSELEEL